MESQIAVAITVPTLWFHLMGGDKGLPWDLYHCQIKNVNLVNYLAIGNAILFG